MSNAVFVICYDIENDKNRTKLAQLCEEFAVRVQKSVYEARLPPEKMQEYAQKCQKFISDGDSLRIYHLGADNIKKSYSIGGAPITDLLPYWMV